MQPRVQGRFAPLTDFCAAGQHRWVPANIYIMPSTGKRQCKECQENRRLDREFNKPKPRENKRFWPSKSGKCRKGRHVWAGDNIVQDRSGRFRCRECRREASRKYHEAHPGRRMCVVKGCNHHTWRQSGGDYICPKHRQNPPSWIATLGLRIVGTEVLAA